MHRMVIVVGEDVDAQMDGLMAENEEGFSFCDWWGKGGRYSGALPLKPGGAGEVFGYCVSPMEEAIGKMFSEATGEEVRPLRPVDHSGGADQALARDVDLARVSTATIVRGGEIVADFSWDVVSPETTALMIADRMGVQRRRPDDQEMARAERELAAWAAIVRQHLQGLPPDTLLTVVDTHS